jgi:curved DNA-binding protein CbpA
VIRLKDILLEGMTPDVADTIFAKFGIKSASSLDKDKLKNYYIALVKKHHPDVGGSNKNMQYINAAYDVLSQTSNSKSLDAKYWNDLWKWRRGEGPAPDQTYPKGKNKARLQSVEVQFQYDDGTPVPNASGKSDYFDLLKIFQSLKRFDIQVRFNPSSPYDEANERWRTNNIIIYVSSNSRSRTYIYNVVHGVCENYF